MRYTEEFQKTLMGYCTIDANQEIDKAIQINNHNKVRLILENQLDDPIMFFNGKIRDNFKSTFNGRKKAYSLFMNEYVKYIDAYNNRRR